MAGRWSKVPISTPKSLVSGPIFTPNSGGLTEIILKLGHLGNCRGTGATVLASGDAHLGAGVSADVAAAVGTSLGTGASVLASGDAHLGALVSADATAAVGTSLGIGASVLHSSCGDLLDVGA